MRLASNCRARRPRAADDDVQCWNFLRAEFDRPVGEQAGYLLGFTRGSLRSPRAMVAGPFGAGVMGIALRLASRWRPPPPPPRRLKAELRTALDWGGAIDVQLLDVSLNKSRPVRACGLPGPKAGAKRWVGHSLREDRLAGCGDEGVDGGGSDEWDGRRLAIASARLRT